LVSYVVSGLNVASDLMLPGLIALDAGRAVEPDVVIRAGEVPEALDGASVSGPNWQLAGDRFLFRVPDAIRLLLIGGRELVYQPEAGTTAAEAAIFLSGTGFGILLQQRGRAVLHASAVRVGTGVVLFCGPSGAGKSTLAAALVDAGHELVADDICGVTIDADGTPWVAPDGRQLKLWQNAIDRLALGDSRAAAVRPAIQKYYVEPRGVTLAALPLSAIYALREARPPHAPGIARANVADAGVIVHNNAYRPPLVRHLDQRDLYFRAAAAIAQRDGVYTLTRELNFAAMPSVLTSLQAQWRELGLLDQAA